MRKLATALAIAALGLTTACGSDTGSQVESAGAQASSAAGEAADAAGSAAEGASPEGSSTEGAGGGQTLVASVGEQGNPDAFVINLTDESGQKVTSLPAGEYQIQVNDPSAIHNFHLTGPGDVDEFTTVPGKTDTTWQVSLEAGEYTYVCDPHPRMVGMFTVTA